MLDKYINKLAGQRVLIVGGTSGIGFCLAENALEHEATVIVASSKQASIDKTLSRLEESYPQLKSKISGHKIDLNSSEVETQIVHLLQAATNGGTDPLDHITVTAGAMPPLTPIDKFQGAAALLDAQQFRILVPLLFAKHAPNKYLRSSKRSSMTFMAGNSRPRENFYLPNLLRGAMEGMVKSLAFDLRPVRVNMVSPGATETELFSNHMSSEQLEGLKRSMRDSTLTGEIGNPEDVCEALLYVIKDANVTAQSLYSDGGLLYAPGSKM